MKPTIEDIIQKLTELNSRGNLRSNNWILTELIAEELHEHVDNVLPCLLLLEREECLKFSSRKREAVRLLKKELAA